MIEAYPLQWPAGWPRTSYRKDSKFDTSFTNARDSLMERAFSGFAALPDPEDAGGRSWREILGLKPDCMSIMNAEFAYKQLRSRHHPDKGGDANEFQAVQRAIEQARSELCTSE